MSLGDIFSDAIKYPFSDITKFLIVGIIALLAGLSNVIGIFEVDSTALYGIAAIIGFIFSLILSGYCVSVIKKGIEYSDEIPAIDFMKNLVDGIKVFVISIVYMIIPIIIAVLLLGVSGVVGAGIDHVVATLGVASIIVLIVFILFAIFEIVALARFADTDDFGAALSIGEVFEDVKKIGILQIIVFLIVVLIVIVIASLIGGILGFIPVIGIIIAQIILGGFITLFYSKALGLLYASA